MFKLERFKIFFKGNMLEILTTPKKKTSYNIFTCSYCNYKGPTPNTCYIRKYSVQSVKYVWVEQGINHEY